MKNKEIFRMQQLAGLITESEIRTKMNEGPQYRPIPDGEWEKLDIDWDNPNPDGSIEGKTADGREFYASAYYDGYGDLVIKDDSVEEYLGWENK